MASVRKEILIDASPADVWGAIRDFRARARGARIRRRHSRRRADRIVTFFSGAVQREPLVDLDDESRRLVYSAVDSPLGATHYNASVQAFADGETRSRVEWIVDVLPNEIGPVLGQLMDRGAAAMKQTLDGGAR